MDSVAETSKKNMISAGPINSLWFPLVLKLVRILLREKQITGTSETEEVSEKEIPFHTTGVPNSRSSGDYPAHLNTASPAHSRWMMRLCHLSVCPFHKQQTSAQPPSWPVTPLHPQNTSAQLTSPPQLNFFFFPFNFNMCFDGDMAWLLGTC